MAASAIQKGRVSARVPASQPCQQIVGRRMKSWLAASSSSRSKRRSAYGSLASAECSFPAEAGADQINHLGALIRWCASHLKGIAGSIDAGPKVFIWRESSRVGQGTSGIQLLQMPCRDAIGQL